MSRLFTFVIHGVTVQLRVDPPELIALAEGLYSACQPRVEDCAPDAPAQIAWENRKPGQTTLVFRGTPVLQATTEAELYFQSEHMLNQMFTIRLDRLLHVHAAAVVTPDGGAWLVCGPSRAGKTSLTLALLLHGWQWLSDEFVFFDPNNLANALGFRRNFNLKEPSFPLFPETASLPHNREFFSHARQTRIRFIDPTDLSPNGWRESAPLSGILLPRFDDQITAPQLERKDSLEAVQVLLGETACWQPWALQFLSRICQELPVLEFAYNHPRHIEPLVEEIQRNSS
ncbi:MAG: hypothetical protein AB1705_01705 [Verrucomicrobiota bacterium]